MNFFIWKTFFPDISFLARLKIYIVNNSLHILRGLHFYKYLAKILSS